MGCKASKLEDKPLVNLCKERKEGIKTAVDHRFALATAHIAYFSQLRHVGDSLSRFVDEEIIVSPSSPSSLSSLSSKTNHHHGGMKSKSNNSTSDHDSHFQWSTSSSVDSDPAFSSDHDHDVHGDVDVEDGDHEYVTKVIPSPQRGISYISHTTNDDYYPYSFDYSNVNNYVNSYYDHGSTYNTAYYMKKSSTKIPSIIYKEPKESPIYTFSDYGSNNDNVEVKKVNSKEKEGRKMRAPSPPSPEVSAWDYFNPFHSFESEVDPGYYYSNKGGYGYGYGYGSNTSSPDSREVREMEGIPELEEETESEVIIDRTDQNEKMKMRDDVSFPESNKNKNKNTKKKKTVQFEDQTRDIGDDNQNKNGGLEPLEPEVEQKQEPEQVEVEDSLKNAKTSVFTTSSDEKGVNLDGDSSSSHLDMESSKMSSSLSSSKMSSSLSSIVQGTRDLGEVVREIKDEFEAATNYGKEVSLLLDVDKEPYKSRKSFLKVMLASICSASMSSFHSPSSLIGEYVQDIESHSLTSTLEKLYAWETKLYKEVKDEEKLRIMYQRQCKKLKTLYDRGDEDGKIEATQASIKKLLIKINVSIKVVNSISNRIHKLRDEELQYHLKELILGLRRMWKLMLRCHHKQFQAILEIKTRTLKASTALRRDSTMEATIHLEMDLLKWCKYFNNWIEMQRSYAATLNNWLKKCLYYEPEITIDGEVPYSPTRVGAPQVFIICNDWKQVTERMSVSDVQSAMSDFATSLHQLRDYHNLKSENMYRDLEKQMREIRMEMVRKGIGYDDSVSDKNSGISAMDDLKVDLDSMRERIMKERSEHKEAMKLVQGGLIPIFEAMESFTSGASKGFDNVRLEHVNA